MNHSRNTRDTNEASQLIQQLLGTGSQADSLEMTQEEKDLQSIVKAIMAGATLAELKGIAKEDLESLYGVAYDFYAQDKLSQAEQFFRFLCIYDFYNADYLMGLAAVYHMQKQYQKACDVYGIAFMQSELDLCPIFYMGQCQLALGKTEQAKQAFESIAQEKDEAICPAPMREKAEAYLAAMLATPSRELMN